MKPHRMPESLRQRHEVVATFGQAQMIRTLDGKCQLKGGTDVDRQKAKEWMVSFLPEALQYLER
jgi:hypothetical protein